MTEVKVDIKSEQGIDVAGIMSLPGYAGHKVEPQGDGRGGTRYVWLKVEGVDPVALDQLITNYDHAAIEADAKARVDLEKSDNDMARRAEEVVELLLEVGAFTKKQLEEKSPGITDLMNKRKADRLKIIKK